MREYPIKRPDMRLMVRAQRPDDWEALYMIRDQPNVRPNILSIPYYDVERFRASRSGPYTSSHIVVAEAIHANGQKLVVGGAGLHRAHGSGSDRADLGIQIHQDYHGIGVGSALMDALCDLADQWLNLHRIDLDVFIDNAAGIALYKKFGFAIEATTRRFAFRDGAHGDSYVMGRLNPHHEKIQNAAIPTHEAAASEESARLDRRDLTIRGRKADDWFDLWTLCQAQPAHLNPLELPYLSEDHARTELGKVPDQQHTFALVAEWEGQLVGEITFKRSSNDRQRHTGKIERFVIAQNNQGQAIGSQLLAAAIDLAENWLNLTRIEQHVHADQGQTIALYQAAGFAIEGTLRDYAYRAGRYVDALAMARVREI